MKMRETSRDTDKKPCVNNYLTWANQIRLLQLNIQQLAATIGQGLIAAVLPAIQALNSLMSKLQEAANTFKVFMYTLMGKKVEGSQGGIVDDVTGGMEDIGGDLSDGLDDATDSAEKLKKALSVLPFDELNQLASNLESASDNDGSGDIGNIGTGGIGWDENLDDLGDVDVETPINEFAKKIRNAFLKQDWEELGSLLGQGINSGIEKFDEFIKWENVEEKIRTICDGITTTFNSMIEEIEWYDLGNTFADGVNTIVNTGELLIGENGFDFTLIGTSISEALRGAIENIEWTNLGNLLGDGFMVAWKILNGFVKDMSKENSKGYTGWESLGIAAGNALNGAFQKINFSTIGETLALGLNGAFSFLATWAETFEWEDLVNNISNGITTFIEEFEWKENGERLNTFLNNLLDALLELAESIPWEEFGKKIGEFLSEIKWGEILKKIVDIISTTLGGLFEGLEASGTAGSILSWLLKAFGLVKVTSPIRKLVNKLTGKSGLTGQSSVSKMVSGFSSLLKGGMAAFTSGKAVEGFVGGISSLVTYGAQALGGAGTASFDVIGNSILDKISEGLQSLMPDWAYDTLSNIGGGLVVGAAAGTAIPGLGTVAGAILGGIIGGLSSLDYSELWDTIVKGWNSVTGKVLEIAAEVKNNASQWWKSVQKWWGKVVGSVEEFTTNVKDDATQWWKNIQKWWDKKVDSVSDFFTNVNDDSSKWWDNTKKWWSEKVDNVEDFVTGVKNQASTWWSNTKKWWSEKVGSVEDFLTNVKDNSTQWWSNTKKWWSEKVGSVEDFVTGVKNNSWEWWKDVKSWWENRVGDVEKFTTGVRNQASTWWNNVKGWWGQKVGYVSDFFVDVADTASSWWNNVQNWWYSFTRGKSLSTTATVTTVHRSVGGYSYGGSSRPFTVQRFANGGFPKYELWGMNESGNPEMVGELGNGSTRTAVANNATIAGAIESAVERAMTRSLMNNSGNQQPINLYATLYTEDNEVLARAVAKGQESIDYRYNPTPQFG